MAEGGDKGEGGRSSKKRRKKERKGEEQLEDIMHCYFFHFFSNIPHLAPGNFLELWNYFIIVALAQCFSARSVTLSCLIYLSLVYHVILLLFSLFLLGLLLLHLFGLH